MGILRISAFFVGSQKNLGQRGLPFGPEPKGPGLKEPEPKGLGQRGLGQSVGPIMSQQSQV